MIAAPVPEADRLPASPSSSSVSRSNTRTAAGAEGRAASSNMSGLVAAAGSQVLNAKLQKGGNASSATPHMQHNSAGTSGRQETASNGSSESSELENKQAPKRAPARKDGPVLRRVQSE